VVPRARLISISGVPGRRTGIASDASGDFTMNNVRMDNMSWIEYENRVKAGAVVFLPCGATEQHGPHLPLGTDALLASAISEDVAFAINGIVAPALSYGYKSQPKCGGGQHFCGTTSVDGATLTAVVRDAVREFHRHGVKRLVLVIGHYENQWFVTEGIELALRDIGSDTGLEVMRLEHWEFVNASTLATIFPNGFPGIALEHAAVIETSMMLHYHPDMVALDKIPEHGPAEFPVYDIYPTRTEWVPESGVLSSAKGSTAQKGKLLVDDVVEGISRAVRYEFLLPETP
jgi:creatinine amidohydrolase